MPVSRRGMLAGWELDMHLIEILLPLRDPEGNPFPGTQFDHLARELTEAFGGVTAFARSPAKGRWKDAARPRATTSSCSR